MKNRVLLISALVLVYMLVSASAFAGTTVQQPLTITVVPQPLQITTTSLPNAQETIPYTQQLGVVGGYPPYVWSVASGTLPNGLSLAANGVLSGTPLVGDYSSTPYAFTVQVTDSAQTAVLLPIRVEVNNSNALLYELPISTRIDFVGGQ